MSKKLSPEDLQNESEFELLAVVSHKSLREFIVDQITKEKTIIRIYSVYQVIMLMLFTFIFTRGIILSIKGNHDLIVTLSGHRCA